MDILKCHESSTTRGVSLLFHINKITGLAKLLKFLLVGNGNIIFELYEIKIYLNVANFEQSIKTILKVILMNGI